MKSTTRVIFKFRDRYYKLFNFFFGKDGSFYFTIYRYDDEITERARTEKTPDGHFIINPNEVVEGQFPARKISIHASGEIHVQDKDRNIETTGIVSWSLAETDYRVILAVFPQSIEKLIPLDAPRNTDLIVNLPDNIEPFTVQVAVHRKGAAQNMPPGKHVSIQIDDIPTHELIIMIVMAIKAPEQDIGFPARTVYFIQ